MGREIDDDELLAIQARASRVLRNGTTSGSARRLAMDAFRLTYIMLGRSKSYKLRLQREEYLRRQQEVMDQLAKELGQ